MKIPWRRKWQPIPVFLPGKSHGQRSLVSYSPWGHKEPNMTEHTWHTLHTRTHPSTHIYPDLPTFAFPIGSGSTIQMSVYSCFGYYDDAFKSKQQVQNSIFFHIHCLSISISLYAHSSVHLYLYSLLYLLNTSFVSSLVAGYILEKIADKFSPLRRFSQNQETCTQHTS